jgi:hypothetical protein
MPRWLEILSDRQRDHSAPRGEEAVGRIQPLIPVKIGRSHLGPRPWASGSPIPGADPEVRGPTRASRVAGPPDAEAIRTAHGARTTVPKEVD